MPKMIEGAYNWHRLLDVLIEKQRITRDELARAVGLVKDGTPMRQQVHRALHSPNMQGLLMFERGEVRLKVDYPTAIAVYFVLRERGPEHVRRLLGSPFFRKALEGPISIHLASMIGAAPGSPDMEFMLKLCSMSPSALAVVIGRRTPRRGTLPARRRGEELPHMDSYRFILEMPPDARNGETEAAPAFAAHRDMVFREAINGYFADLQSGQLTKPQTAPVRVATEYVFEGRKGFRIKRSAGYAIWVDGGPVLREIPKVTVERVTLQEMKAQGGVRGAGQQTAQQASKRRKQRQKTKRPRSRKKQPSHGR